MTSTLYGQDRIMSLINVNNARSIEVKAVSIKLHSDDYGQGYLDTSSINDRAIEGTLAKLAYSRATMAEYREAIDILSAILNHSRSLYSLQFLLNWDGWEALRVTVEVEARVTQTGTGQEGAGMVFLVKTTHQEEQATYKEVI